ncbi:YfiR family protein [Fulvivirga sediminis]|uniref:YfiR family protein n=1 Tax=Fulvivirga sediminis TaxID=2803949 RepID=A0A937F9Y6_9BACT|nr:YfiR family protein [Fulvivirga sediminis]MBL3656643.1 YfiR family protein [Fulvivirga sediminis]
MIFFKNILRTRSFWIQACVLPVAIFSFLSFSIVPDINAKVKAIFLYNFSKYIEWPAEQTVGNFKIVIFGNYPALEMELRQMASQKTRGAQRFEIEVYNDLMKIPECHILYIAKSKNGEVSKLSDHLKLSNTLIVSDKDGPLSNGVGINFYYEHNKQKFEISVDNLSEHQLKPSDQLKLLAKTVD